MKYIFVSGAPGSKWSSVVKNIYYSADVDSTDYSEARTYRHDASGTMELLHMGVYWGPAMEFGNQFEHLDKYTKEQNEAEFDAPFSGTGVRIIKSHVFGYHIDYIKKTWPDCPIVLIDRSDDACLGWWVKCGEFKITYPLYRDYYRDLREMAAAIARENRGNRQAARDYPSQLVETNRQLARTIGIQVPATEYYQDYIASDITVKVI
jgi:hypothetical protein